jgi:hypothetical protein
MKESHEIALISLTAIEGVQVYSAFLPSIFTIRTFAAQDYDKTKKDIRDGEVLASAMSIALGVAMAVLMDSHWPIVASIANAALMVFVYEYALHTAHADASSFTT